MAIETLYPPDEPIEASAKAPRKHRLSDILDDIALDETRERVSVADLFSAMGDRAFGALMLIFALPNVVPTPPGTSAITGAPLVFLSAQLMCGLSPWLPAFIGNRSIKRTDFAKIVTRITPWLARAEKMLRPRLSIVVSPRAEYLLGLLCFLLSVIMILPIPLGNMLPAIAICFFSLGILERDGVCALIGIALFGASIVVVGGVVWALVKAFFFVVAQMFY
jgi:hypothetical protein